MILAVIIACEIGFWVAIVAGLVARYVLRAPRVGGVLLALAPVIDVVLLVTTALHLRSGETATWHHGVAALYIGFSVAYGHRMIAWADVRFAHRFAGGPAPVKPRGWAYTLLCWADVARTLLAAAISAVILLGLVRWVDDPSRTESLSGLLPVLGLIVGVEVLWAVSYTIWPKADEPQAARSRADEPQTVPPPLGPGARDA